MGRDGSEALDREADSESAWWGLAAAAAVLALATTACGGGNSTPGTPSTPTPPSEVFSVAAFVYFDENRNNAVDGGEDIRLGDVEIEIAGRAARSTGASGAVVVAGVPAGAHPVTIRTSSLPPYFVPGGSVTAQVPSTTEIPLPVALPIGQNVPFRYLASGDSISQGTGSADSRGYRVILEARLEGYYGRSVSTYYRGGLGGTSADGASRIARDLQLLEPAYTLIEWGTNDWNECGSPSTCFTVPSLRSIVREAKQVNSLPCVATILPANVGYDSRAPASRNVWVAEANDLIRAMAREEGAAVVDLHAAFMRAPSLSSLFIDHVHPNPDGHELIATTFFETLTRPRSLTGAASFFWDEPGGR
jgi:lysophospholipase L1-like esterase